MKCKFTPVAKRKIKMLLENKDCKGINSINSNFVILDFDGGTCTITNQAKVIWNR